MVSKELNLLVRGLQFLWSLLVIALVGNMIATAIKGNPAIVNYDMFVAVFGMLSLLYFIPTTFKEDLAIPIVNVALDALNVLFWFCGAVATAAYLHVHSCSNEDYTKSNFITNGSADTTKRCREAQASTAFLWFGFFTFVGSAVITFMASQGGVNLRGINIRRGGASTPAMSQV